MHHEQPDPITQPRSPPAIQPCAQTGLGAIPKPGLFTQLHGRSSWPLNLEARPPPSSARKPARLGPGARPVTPPFQQSGRVHSLEARPAIWLCKRTGPGAVSKPGLFTELHERSKHGYSMSRSLVGHPASRANRVWRDPQVGLFAQLRARPGMSNQSRSPVHHSALRATGPGSVPEPGLFIPLASGRATHLGAWSATQLCEQAGPAHFRSRAWLSRLCGRRRHDHSTQKPRQPPSTTSNQA